jgi:hypothetical protein
MTNNNDRQDPREEENKERLKTDPQQSEKKGVTHNLDTGKDEPLSPEPNDQSIMDFASGSGGSSAGDGAGA